MIEIFKRFFSWLFGLRKSEVEDTHSADPVFVCRVRKTTCDDPVSSHMWFSTDKMTLVLTATQESTLHVCMRFCPTETPEACAHILPDLCFNLYDEENKPIGMPDTRTTCELCKYFFAFSREKLAEITKKGEGSVSLNDGTTAVTHHNDMVFAQNYDFPVQRRGES